MAPDPSGHITRRVCTGCGRCRSLSDFMPDRPRRGKTTLLSRCRDCRAVASRAYREQHRERILEQQRAWNARNAERLRPYRVEQYQARREEICARERARYARVTAADPNKYRERFHRRRAQIQGNGGSYTSEEWQELCAKYGHICLACHRKIKLTVDHVIPISRGGTNDIGNLQPLCLRCNLQKSDRILDYRKYHDSLLGEWKPKDKGS